MSIITPEVYLASVREREQTFQAEVSAAVVSLLEDGYSCELLNAEGTLVRIGGSQEVTVAGDDREMYTYAEPCSGFRFCSHVDLGDVCTAEVGETTMHNPYHREQTPEYVVTLDSGRSVALTPSNGRVCGSGRVLSPVAFLNLQLYLLESGQHIDTASVLSVA